MKAFLTACFVVCGSVAFSQKVIDVDKAEGLPPNAFYTVSGSPVVNYRFVRLVQGTPYFKDSWMKGLLVSAKDQPYKSNNLKLNLVDQELHFLNEKGEELINTLPLKQVTLTDTVNNASYTFVHSSFVPALSGVKKGWYLQLVNGKVSLFQFFTKVVHEDKPYNSGVAEQRIYTTEEFLIVYNGSLLKAKKPKEVPALLTDGKAELEAFLKKGEMKNASVAEQMTAMITYYNNLQ